MGERFIRDGYTEKIILRPKADISKLVVPQFRDKFSVVSKIMKGGLNSDISFEMMKKLNPVDVYSILYGVGTIKSDDLSFREFTQKYKNAKIEDIVKRFNDEAYDIKVKTNDEQSYSLFGHFKKIQKKHGNKKGLYAAKNLLLPDVTHSLEQRVKNLPIDIQFGFHESVFKPYSVPQVVDKGDFTTVSDYLRYIIPSLNLERSDYEILNTNIITDNLLKTINKIEVLSNKSGNMHTLTEHINKETNEVKINCNCKQYEFSSKKDKTCNDIKFYLDQSQNK